jgi:hypothetical protein
VASLKELTAKRAAAEAVRAEAEAAAEVHSRHEKSAAAAAAKVAEIALLAESALSLSQQVHRSVLMRVTTHLCVDAITTEVCVVVAAARGGAVPGGQRGCRRHRCTRLGCQGCRSHASSDCSGPSSRNGCSKGHWCNG